MNKTFSLNNYRLRKYLIKLLNYNQFDSGSYNKLKSELKDQYVLDLIGRDEFKELKGIERENYINKLIAEIQYLGDPVIKNVSYAARNLWYESEIKNVDMNKRELFTELRKLCAKSDNPASRKAFNDLVKSFGASISAAGIGDGGVDLTGEPLTQEEIDEAAKRASGQTFAENEIKDFDSFKSWLHNFMKNAHEDKYDEGLTDKVANDLHKKYGEDYGAMIGAAKSFLFE